MTKLSHGVDRRPFPKSFVDFYNPIIQTLSKRLPLTSLRKSRRIYMEKLVKRFTFPEDFDPSKLEDNERIGDLTDIDGDSDAELVNDADKGNESHDWFDKETSNIYTLIPLDSLDEVERCFRSPSFRLAAKKVLCTRCAEGTKVVTDFFKLFFTNDFLAQVVWPVSL